jgi:hypothetical protein
MMQDFPRTDSLKTGGLYQGNELSVENASPLLLYDARLFPLKPSFSPTRPVRVAKKGKKKT